MLFDTHAHFDDKRFLDDQDEVIQNAFNSGVKYILNAAASPKSLDTGLELAEKYPNIYASVGVHPHDASNMNDELLDKMEKLSRNPKVVAIGEIGLDYHYDFSPREIQKKWLIKQIELAKKINFPVIIHNRESTDDMLKIIKETNVREVGGVFHCFSGSIEIANILLENNFYLSFGGPITFKNAKNALEVIKKIPLDRILIETDSPYLTPEPYRGKRNDSSYVVYVARKIAEVRGLDFQEIAEITTKNAINLFKINP